MRILHFSDLHIGVENYSRPATEADVEALPSSFAPATVSSHRTSQASLPGVGVAVGSRAGGGVTPGMSVGVVVAAAASTEVAVGSGVAVEAEVAVGSGDPQATARS